MKNLKIIELYFTNVFLISWDSELMEVVTDSMRPIGVANLQRMLVLLLPDVYTSNSYRVHHICEISLY